MRYDITSDNIHIYDSAFIERRYIPYWVEEVWSDNPYNGVVEHRSKRSARLEWYAHNAAYKVGIARTRTKDCDINYPLRWWERLLYPVAGVIGWFIID